MLPTGLPPELFADRIFRRYSARLLHLAEDRLNRGLRSKVGPEDIVQSAFKSFFRRINDFVFDHESPDAIWALLVVITIRKCRKLESFFHRDNRSLTHERTPETQQSYQLDEHATDAIGPAEAAAVTELFESLLSHFDERRQAMVTLRIEGYSLDEIAEKCRSSRRTVAHTISDAKLELARILKKLEET